MREDRAGLSERARRVDAALEVLRRRRARERDRQPVPPELHDAVTEFGLGRRRLGRPHEDHAEDAARRT